MGYTTNFGGKFTLSKMPSGETIATLLSIAGERGDDTGYEDAPDSYCQWTLTKDCRHLEWDGGEKFYLYVEWLQFIHDKFLKREGITLDGEVEFDGEDASDSGKLAFVKGKVAITKRQFITDDMAELIKFRDFVLKSDWADEIKDEWKRRNK